MIAGPALRTLLFMEESNPLAAMFVNLLSQAIDRNVQHRVHPGFVSVLEQISPDEALLLHKLQCEPLLGAQTAIQTYSTGEPATVHSLTSFPAEDFVDPDSIVMYFEHLVSLSVVHRADDITVTDGASDITEKYRWYSLSHFGRRFLEVCGQTTTVVQPAE